jgi:hypothetical protein
VVTGQAAEARADPDGARSHMAPKPRPPGNRRAGRRGRTGPTPTRYPNYLAGESSGGVSAMARVTGSA